jgi:hypothetical protein
MKHSARIKKKSFKNARLKRAKTACFTALQAVLSFMNPAAGMLLNIVASHSCTIEIFTQQPCICCRIETGALFSNA